MFKIFPSRRTKILSIFAAIIASWGFLVFAIYDAGHPTEGITGALIQTIKSNPDLKKEFSEFTNPSINQIATPSATTASPSTSLQN